MNRNWKKVSLLAAFIVSSQALGSEIDTLKAAIVLLQEELHKATPKGSIQAFNLKSCPNGWILYEKAVGRTLVGISQNRQLGKGRGQALSDLEERSHSHSVNPVAKFTSSSGSHNHTVDPASRSTNSSGSHNHRWADFDAKGEWESFNSNGSWIQVFDWGDGIGDGGSGEFPLAKGKVDSTVTFYTDNIPKEYFDLLPFLKTRHHDIKASYFS